MPPLRILYVSPRQSWPPVTGGKLRDFHLTRALSRHATVTVAYYAQPEDQPVALPEVPFYGGALRVPAPRRYTAWKVVRGLTSRWPMVVLNYTSPEMIRGIKNLLASEPFDAVHVDSIHMAACLDQVKGELGATPVFYNWHNIESELMARHAGHGSFPRRAYARLTARRLRELETELLRAAAGHVVCSSREMALLQERVPPARIAVVENGVDVASFLEIASWDGPRRRIIFVGSMDYEPNIEGALYFAQTVWPKLRSAFPEWTLTLVGSRPVAAVRALASDPTVEVTGTVPDVRPYYQEAVAAVVPLRVGGGTRLKIIEAMAAGVPVISTALGAEGLDVRPGRDILLAESEQEWRAAFEKIRSAEFRRQLAGASHELIERYDWDRIGERFFEIYQQWIADRR